MIRVPRRALDEATDVVASLVMQSCDSQGKVIMMRPNPEVIQKHLLAMIAIMSPSKGPDIALPEDIHQTGMDAGLPQKIYTSGRSLFSIGGGDAA